MLFRSHLPPSDHLADREEADNLGGDDANTGPLLPRQVPHAVEDACGLRAGGLGLLEDGSGAEAAEELLEVRLEGRSITKERSQTQREDGRWGSSPGIAYGGLMRLSRITNLLTSRATLE